MTLQITERDKKILMLLAIVVVVAGFVFLGVLPLIDENKQLDTDIELAEQSRMDMEDKIISLPGYRTSYQDAQDGWTAVADGFNPMMSSQEIDKMITGVALSCGLDALDMTITFQAEGQTVEPYYASMLALGQQLQAAGTVNSDTTDTTQSSGGSSTADAAAAAEAEAADTTTTDDTTDTAGQTYVTIADVSLRTEGDAKNIQKLIDTFSDNYPGIRITDLTYDTNEITKPVTNRVVNQAQTTDQAADQTADQTETQTTETPETETIVNTVLQLGLELYMSKN